MKKEFYFGTNTKMYMTAERTKDYLAALGTLCTDLDRSKTELFVIPSFTSLHVAKPLTQAGNILLGAQNMHWDDFGAHTGDISPLMLEEAGVQVVEIGHSERRHDMGETDEMENRKVLSALRHGFTALLCVGETEAEKENGISAETLSRQLKLGLLGVDSADCNSLWVAYEPVWAIGEHGKPASADYAEKMHRHMRTVLCELFGEAGEQIPLLYGGSVHLDNAAALAREPHIDGLFVGRSAWEAENFRKLMDVALCARREAKSSE